jgi:hypothetical protein
MPARIGTHGRDATAADLATIKGQSERQKAHKPKGAHSFLAPRWRQRRSLMSSTHLAVTKASSEAVFGFARMIGL